MKIINCHIHTFTIRHVPNRFLPLPLMKAIRLIIKWKMIRKPIFKALRKLIPFTDRDIVERYVNFVEIVANKKQEQIFEHVKGYYSEGTKFIILPMDMEFMINDKVIAKVKENYELQLKELLKLKDKYPNQALPFVAVDPRRKDAFEIAKKYINEHSFYGIKIYPRLGFYPNDERLFEIYDFAQSNNIPIMTHCSRGGVYTKNITEDMLEHPTRGTLPRKEPKEFSHYFTEPLNYIPLLEKYPRLKICLAHFGGNSEWVHT